MSIIFAHNCENQSGAFVRSAGIPCRSLAQCDQPRIPKHKHCGLKRRLAAIVYDSFVLTGLLFFATGLIAPFNAGQAIRPDQWLLPAYLISVSFLFFGWFRTHGD
ncbi:MAG: hypothetical protein ACRER2_18250 [Methylococcales bacterium]